MKRLLLALCLIAVLLALPYWFAGRSIAQKPHSEEPPNKHAASGVPAGFPDLVKGLKAVPGCLGVETAQTGSGKQVVFAWFENKKAALAWYYSDMHQGAMKTFFPGFTNPTPMKDIKDDGKPLMVIASLTPAKKGTVGGTDLPISQIAVELYSAAPGGVAVGGRFAPSTFKVNGLTEIPAAQK